MSIGEAKIRTVRIENRTGIPVRRTDAPAAAAETGPIPAIRRETAGGGAQEEPGSERKESGMASGKKKDKDKAKKKDGNAAAKKPGKEKKAKGKHAADGWEPKGKHARKPGKDTGPDPSGAGNRPADLEEEIRKLEELDRRYRERKPDLPKPQRGDSAPPADTTAPLPGTVSGHTAPAVAGFDYPEWCMAFDMKPAAYQEAAVRTRLAGRADADEVAGRLRELETGKARKTAIGNGVYGFDHSPEAGMYSGIGDGDGIARAIEGDAESVNAAGKAMIEMAANIGRDPYASDPVVREPHLERTWFGFDDLDIATGYLKRLKGLMGRESIPEEYALFFPKCRAVHTHMMKCPIDIIYLDGEDRVLGVECLGPKKKSNAPAGTESILECRAASVYERDIRIGDYLDRGWGAVDADGQPDMEDIG